MKYYKVVHVQRQNYPVAYLSYDTKTQQFSLRIRKDVKLVFARNDAVVCAERSL